MKTVELFALALTLFGGLLWITRRSFALAARARGHRVPMRLTCPKRGCSVDCTLVLDERRGRYLGVDACSAFGHGARPRCAETCAWLLNEGIPLEVPPHEEPLQVHLPIHRDAEVEH